MHEIKSAWLRYAFFMMAAYAFTSCEEVSSKKVSLGEEENRRGLLKPESVSIPDSFTLGDYVEWINNPATGHVVEESTQDFRYRVSYRPILYDALSFKGQSAKSEQEVKAICEAKEGELIICLDETPVISSTQHLVQNTSLGGYERFDPLFVAGKDTLHKAFIHMEYGLNGQKRYYIIYKRPQKWTSEDFTHAEFVWKSSNDAMRIYFLKKILDHSPKIRYK